MENIFQVLGKIYDNYSEKEIIDHLLTIKRDIEKVEKNVFETIETVFDVTRDYFLIKNFDREEIGTIKCRLINICFINLFGKIENEKEFCLKYNFNINTYNSKYKRQLKNIKENEKFDKDLSFYIKQTENKFKELTIKNL